MADEEALAAFQLVSRLEGIIPALETSHALAYLDKLCPTVPDGTRIVLNCSGRGDKDVTVSCSHVRCVCVCVVVAVVVVGGGGGGKCAGSGI